MKVWGRPFIWLIISLGLVAIRFALGLGEVFGEYLSARHGGNYMFNFYLPPAPSSTPWAPTWSPDGKWIAVAMSGSIWKVDPQTGVGWELTHDHKYHSLPDWSPDGEWIVYTADDGGNTIQLEILNVRTGETRALTEDRFLYLDPAFSPDGQRLTYVSTRPNGYFNVFVRPIRDGRWNGGEVAVTKDRQYPRDRLYFGPWDMHITPTWTPDGKDLLLVSNRNKPLGSGDVWQVPAQMDGIEKGKQILQEQTLYRTRPHISPDGTRFVYSSTSGTADQFNNLYVQPIIGGEPYKLTFFQHDAFHPRWSPDGEWIAYVDNREGLPQLALLETYGGANRILRLRDRRFRKATGILRIQIRDKETRLATGARIHLTASDGKFYSPTNTYARISGAGDPIFHTSGSATVELPVGRAQLTVVKGFEYYPVALETDIRAGEVSRLSAELERMTDMAAKGWYSGSTHVHMNYGGNLFNTLENLIMMSEAEDQDIVNEQIANKDNRVLDHQFFVKGGGPHPLSTSERILVVGQEYRPPFYGHVFMFGMRDHLISPFTTGYEGTAIESIYPSNTDMLRKAREQGAVVGYVHAFEGETDPLEHNLGNGKGFIVDAALGTTDALEWSDAGQASFLPLYAVWNNGLRVTAVGGEDSISDLHRTKLVGSQRTYVYVGSSGFSMKTWFEGLRAGRAFMSSGPLVELTVDGSIPGEVVELPEGGEEVEIAVRVRSILPLEIAELVFNGEVDRIVPLSQDRRSADLQFTRRVGKSGWLHLRVSGNSSERFPLDTGYLQAFTNPVWVTVGEQPIRSRASAQYCIRWVDKLTAMAKQWPGWRSEKEKAAVFAQFEEARTIYQRLAEEDN